MKIWSTNHGFTLSWGRRGKQPRRRLATRPTPEANFRKKRKGPDKLSPHFVFTRISATWRLRLSRLLMRDWYPGDRAGRAFLRFRAHVGDPQSVETSDIESFSECISRIFRDIVDERFYTGAFCVLHGLTQ